MPRTFAIGDVHGCHRALVALLGLLSIQSDDTVVFLGDLIDRGPASRQVLDEVIALRKRCKVVLIEGNHEEMMRNALAGHLFAFWFNAGGKSTIDSYGGDMFSIPPEHIKLLHSAQSFLETATDIFIHASLEADVSLANQTADYLRWRHLGGMERAHISGKRVLCGHTPQQDGRPLVMPGWVCLDTFAYGGGWLSALDVEANQIYQANEAGEAREFSLPEP